MIGFAVFGGLLILLSDVVAATQEVFPGHITGYYGRHFHDTSLTAMRGCRKPVMIQLDWDSQPHPDYDGEWLWVLRFGCGATYSGAVPWTFGQA